MALLTHSGSKLLRFKAPLLLDVRWRPSDLPPVPPTLGRLPADAAASSEPERVKNLFSSNEAVAATGRHRLCGRHVDYMPAESATRDNAWLPWVHEEADTFSTPDRGGVLM